MPLTVYQREILALLELLRRRGRVRPEEVARLDLVKPYDPVAGREMWVSALEEADAFARSRPAEEAGCLYYSTGRECFVVPMSNVPLADQEVTLHWGQPGGIIPRVVED